MSIVKIFIGIVLVLVAIMEILIYIVWGDKK